MSLLAALQPLNLDQEYRHFHDDQTYNPQFIYSRIFTQKMLYLYGLPQEKYLQFARDYLREIAPTLPAAPAEKALRPNEISQQTRALFARLHLDPPIIHWEKIISLAKRRQETLIFSKTAPITQSKLDGILAHEVQTHLLRSYNQRLQDLPIEKSSRYARTEEGLASLNSKFARQRADFSTSCYRYLSCAWAQTESFAQVFAKLHQDYGFAFDRAWYFTLRAKRGLTDTSQPGGFTKDIVYLEGALQTLNWLIQPENRPRDLYLGKISLEQVPLYREHARRDGLILPTFIEDSALQAYLDFLRSCRRQLLGLDPF